MASLSKMIYLLTLIIGTTYLVGWLGWSMWTYAFMFVLLGFKFSGKTM